MVSTAVISLARSQALHVQIAVSNLVRGLTFQKLWRTLDLVRSCVSDKDVGHSPELGMPLEFKPKLDKIVELLLYLAYVRPGADKYQVVKLFYLADREHLIRFGRPYNARGILRT